MASDPDEILAAEEGRLKALLASQTEQSALLPLRSNGDFKELARVARARELLGHYSFLRANRWYFLAVALSSLGIAVLSLIHLKAGEISLNAASSFVELTIGPDAEIADLSDLFPDFRVSSIAGMVSARDWQDRPLLTKDGVQASSAALSPAGRLSRIIAPSGATLAVSDCGSQSCMLRVTGKGASALLSVQSAKLCSDARRPESCSEALEKNVAIELSSEATFSLQRLESPPGERDGSTLRPLLVVQGSIGRMSFDRREGHDGLPTGRLNTLGRGTLTFNDFGSEAVVRLAHRELSIVGANGVAEIGLRSQYIETAFVGEAIDARTIVKSRKSETLVPSLLQWLVGNKTLALLGLAISSGVAFLLAVVRRATGKEKL